MGSILFRSIQRGMMKWSISGEGSFIFDAKVTVLFFCLTCKMKELRDIAPLLIWRIKESLIT